MRHHMQVSMHKSTAHGVHPRTMGQSKARALGMVCVRARMAVVDCSGGKAHAKPLRCLRVSARVSPCVGYGHDRDGMVGRSRWCRGLWGVCLYHPCVGG